MTKEVFVFPVSFAQQRLWFLDQLEPGSTFYSVRDTLGFDGPVDHAALAHALNEVIRRHEALRTTFTSVDGQPVQVIARELEVSLPVADLRALPEPGRRAAAARLSAEEFQRPFELERGPLVRALLLQLSDEEQHLLLTLHHIVADGWSLEVLERELRALYTARVDGRPSPLPPLAIQYADYAIWQREWLTGEVLTSQLNYWKTQLEGLPAVLTLPWDHPRPPVQSFRGASQQLRLPPSLADALKALAQQEGVTLFMCLLAAFDVLLYRYAGQEDIVVGTPVAGRNRTETEPLIGFFVNTLVLRTNLSGDPSFRELLGRVRDVALGAYAHQDLPFEKLVEALQPERNLGHHPLFQVMFQLLGAPPPGGDAGDGGGEEGEPGADEPGIESGTAKFDLGVDVFETPDGLLAGVEYSTDLFEHATIQRMLVNLRELLEDMVADPERPISRLALLGPVERERILRQWNETRWSFPADQCIHELFERQARATPERVAVVAAGTGLTYGELNARANQLAHHLRRAGVRAESRVALCLERSADMLIGVFGILKAGGAYVPLDPEYPPERLAYMLEDAGAQVLVTQERLLGTLPPHPARVVCLDRDWGQIEREPATDVVGAAQPENLAYLIYTSGSTGRPKGVMIQHRSLVGWTTRVTVEYGLRADDRILQFASLSFDTAAEEIFPCLTLGAVLCLRTPTMADSIPGFLEQCRAWQITVLDLPTAYWHELTWELASGGWELPPAVRLVIFGGEKALPERVTMWHRTVPAGVRLMQGYGPTETTVVATIADLSPGEQRQATAGEVSIGRVIGGARVYVLDRHQRPVPAGVVGELYIGGNGVARGYLNRPGLTAERFVPDPFSGELGARLYRTGDWVRYLANGELEFRGRSDDQVKIRGYRIELGEVESLLREQSGVSAATVVVRDEGADRKRLVAYVVADPANGFSVPALRRALRDRMPEYMIPSAFVLLDALPLTPNGKINRAALPDPAPAGPDSASARYVPPRNATERLIASVWQEVFQTAELSVHANFFDLGGHSLTLVRVRSRLRDHFPDEIPMVDMFRYPTISALADYLSRDRSVPATDGSPAHPGSADARALKQREEHRRRQTARAVATTDE